MNKHLQSMRIALLIALVALSGCNDADDVDSSDSAAAEATEWQELSLSDFQTFQDEAETWTEQDDMLVCSGQPRGYIYSREEFGDFIWEAEYLLVAPAGEAGPQELTAANTGFMIHIQEPHKVWPVSLEVQGRWDEMCSIKANGGAAELTIDDDAAARESARKPVGEWNRMEITSRGGTLEARLNGELICTSQASALRSGRIGLQSEGFEVHFRKLRIKPLSSDEQ